MSCSRVCLLCLQPTAHRPNRVQRSPPTPFILVDHSLSRVYLALVPYLTIPPPPPPPPLLFLLLLAFLVSHTHAVTSHPVLHSSNRRMLSAYYFFSAVIPASPSHFSFLFLHSPPFIYLHSLLFQLALFAFLSPHFLIKTNLFLRSSLSKTLSELYFSIRYSS